MEPIKKNEYDDALDGALKNLYSITPPPSFTEKWMKKIEQEERAQMSKKTIWQWKGWKTTVLPIAAALVLLLGANWAGDKDWNALPSSNKSETANAALYSRSGNSAGESVTMDYSASESYAVADTAVAGGGLTGSTYSAKQSADSTQRKLIRTVSLTMRTGNYDEDLKAIQALVGSVGGYEEYHYESGDVASGDVRYVEMTLRIPADQLDSFLGGMGSIGRVVNRSENTIDRTTEYTDNETRLNTLNTKMTRLNELLAQAENIEDILAIESQISDTQYEIDMLTGNQLSIDRQVDMSTVVVSMREEKPTEITPEMTFGQKLSRAVKASWEGFGEFLRNALVFVVMALPTIITVAAFVAVFALIRKAVKKRRSAMNEQPDEEKTEE